MTVQLQLGLQKKLFSEKLYDIVSNLRTIFFYHGTIHGHTDNV